MNDNLAEDAKPIWLNSIAGSIQQQLKVSNFENVQCERLRSWELSEVLRLSTSTGESVIAKRGSGDMSHEAEVYESLLKPLNINSANIYATQLDKDVVIILMEDLGKHTLEQKCTNAGYHKAINLLAALRAETMDTIASSTSMFHAFKRTINDYIITSSRAENGLRIYRPELANALKPAVQVFPDLVRKLYSELPPTIVHGDYHAKNLLFKGEGIVPIDWTHTYISPDLSDLYCLMREAENLGYEVPVQEFPTLYETELKAHGIDTDLPIRWQLDVGGLCWSLNTIKWIVEEGLEALPISAGWLNGLVQKANKLSKQF